MRRLSTVLVLSALLAGCAAPSASLEAATARPDVDYSDLAGGAGKVLDGGIVELAWKGTTGLAATAVILTRGAQDPLLAETFTVDARVGFVLANVTLPRTDGAVAVTIRDAEGRVQCGASSASLRTTCTAPVPASLEGPEEWSVVVISAPQPRSVPEPVPNSLRVGLPGREFVASVQLHPPSHITRGDATAGVDPTLRFRVVDTGARGSEDLIGVLGDGTIFAQFLLKTLRSTDDGETWEDVAPVTTSQRSFDPMLHVDPRRGIVYVDQLYIGCSILAWSRDAGESWVTNPAACGAPANDHQKTASGPNPIAGAPFPAVYYAYSSFAEGVWVSRSLDGGVTWTTALVGGTPLDDLSPRNTGPIRADEAGNVVVPYYMCNDGGSIMAGVSNDHGATFRMVKVADDPGPCSDVDAGIAVDEDGVFYIAYHRPDGVRYAWSDDGGRSWSAPVHVSPPTQTAFVHAAAAAGAPGRLAIVWRATSDSAAPSTNVDGWAAWHLYAAVVEDATSNAPLVRVGMVNDPADPVQRGPICMSGVSCVGGSRNLLDFIDAAVGPNGKVYVAYQDGCDLDCETPADSRAGLGLVGILDEGFTLYPEPPAWATVEGR